MEDPGAFYRRYIARCNAHRFDELDDVVAPDVSINGDPRGRASHADGLRTVVDAFPDFRWDVRHLVADGPWLAVHLADTGTHRGEFFGVPATGRSVSIDEFAFYRLEDGRIAEVWGMTFHLQLLEQIR